MYAISRTVRRYQKQQFLKSCHFLESRLDIVDHYQDRRHIIRYYLSVRAERIYCMLQKQCFPPVKFLFYPYGKLIEPVFFIIAYY